MPSKALQRLWKGRQRPRLCVPQSVTLLNTLNTDTPDTDNKRVGGWDSGQGLPLFRTQNPTLRVGRLRLIDTTFEVCQNGLNILK